MSFILKSIMYQCVVFLCVAMAAYTMQVHAQEYKWTKAGEQSDRGQTPAFTEEERYLDIFPLTKKNFSDSVLKRNKDPWIVIFHDGTMMKAWKTMALHLRGIVWIGMIDNTTETQLLKDIGYFDTKDAARVYPYGGSKVKKEGWMTVRDANEARRKAVKSIPDKTQRITGADLQGFVLDSYHSSPTKFPLILAVDDEFTSALFKALAVRFEKYFNFARIVKPTSDDYRMIGLGDVFVETPAVLVLVQSHLQDLADIMDFNAVQYDPKTMGKMTYANVLQFLFAVNSQFRHLLPGDNQSNDKTEAEMEDIIKIEEKRFEVNFGEKNTSADGPREAHSEVTENVEMNITAESRDFGQTKDEL